MRIIIWILILPLFIAGCPKSDKSNDEDTQASADGSMSVDMPPGFESIVELGEFERQDTTDWVRQFNKKVISSVNWTVEKDYDKLWEDFSEEEKHEFDALVETLLEKVSKGVEAKGGVFPVNRPTGGILANSVFGQWIVRYDEKYAPAIGEAPWRWRVDFNVTKTATGEPPNINIFIGRCTVEGEE